MKEKELSQKEIENLYETNQEFRKFADHIATMTDTTVEVVLEWAAIKSVAQTMKGLKG